MRIVSAVLLAGTVGCVYLSTASHPATSNAPNAPNAPPAPPATPARWVTKTPPPPAYTETPPPNANASAV
ncbi:MAG TPA: hypothetical protein VNW46_01635, partial [Gemmatimonadaceae bacterium]|nr:hypothetical protein [Gemmatimonadaceae bacterium]